jgi:hypothetical protein
MIWRGACDVPLAADASLPFEAGSPVFSGVFAMSVSVAIISAPQCRITGGFIWCGGNTMAGCHTASWLSRRAG